MKRQTTLFNGHLLTPEKRSFSDSQWSSSKTVGQICILKQDNFFETGRGVFFATPLSKPLISSRIPIPVFAVVRVVIIAVEANSHSRTWGCAGISNFPIR
jgi:hypothetical protein